MSHELRTPLNAILGFSELLMSDAFAGKRVEYAKLIHNSGALLLDLVNDLLELSRMEAGKLQLHDERIVLSALIDECISTVEPRVVAGKLHLTRNIDKDMPALTADCRALKQILLNLLTNAIKFCPAGGCVEVFATYSASAGMAFGVRDNGPGIAEEDQAHVFERFGQARHVAGAQEGTGLGLPIVKGLAEAHGGSVEMESQLGRGTCITIWLPRTRVDQRCSAARDLDYRASA